MNSVVPMAKPPTASARTAGPKRAVLTGVERVWVFVMLTPV